MKTLPKAVILARVSSKAQEDEGYSLESQLKLMRGYCKTHNLVIDKEFKIAETASKELRRTIFHELVRYIVKSKTQHLIVEKTDRLTCNFKDASTIDTWLEKDERRMLHMVKENLQLHKNARSDAKFMWNIHLSVAQKYTDNLREEAMKGWAEKLAQGWLPAEPPPGYMTVLQDGKKIHVVNPQTYKFMPRIFKLCLLPGFTRQKLSEEMALVGITTKTGRPFSVSFVTRILTDPFYIGINRMQGKDYPGAQEPVISKKLFNDVQRKLKQKGYERTSRKHNPIFKRMITCESCGTKVSWSKQKGVFYGGCQRRKAECQGQKYLREDRVEALVIQKLLEIKDPKGKVFAKVIAALQVVQPVDVGMYRQKMIDELGGQITRLRRMEERLYDDRLSGFISKEKYEEKRQYLADRMVEIAERIAMLRDMQGLNEPSEQNQEWGSPIVNQYMNSSPNQKRIIMSIIFKTITAYGDSVVCKFYE